MRVSGIKVFLLWLVAEFSLCMHPALAGVKTISLNLQHTHLTHAIHLFANFLHLTVIVSPTVNGFATLTLHEVGAHQAFDMLLMSHGLAAWQVGKIWFVAPYEELIKRRQEALKWQAVDDEAAPLLTRVWQIHYAKVEDVARVLQDEKMSLLSKRGRIRVDARTNILYIQDRAEPLTEIRRLIHRLDVPVKQIAIEARLASVDSDFERELGINFAVKPPLSENGGLAPTYPVATEMGRYSLAVAKLADGSLLDVKLSALEKAGHAELISSPSLFTSNQQAASIEAGEEVPYQEVSESGGTAVVFKKAVLGLKVVPQLLPGDNVLLQLQINQDRPSHKMVQGVPTISTRQMVTSVLVKNGQTIVLGGIYETNEERGQLRLPFISQVPLIGLLFRQQSTRENKRELLIFVTPKIIAQET
jgi:type IV pilus assembly protein PilQ